MLNVLRENFKQTPILRIMLAVVGLSMVLSLGYYFVSPNSAAGGLWAARVNGEEISFRDFQLRARLIDDRYRSALGDRYSDFRNPEQIAREAVEALVRDRLIVQDAQRLGLSASKEEVARYLLEDPQFKDESGRFIGRDAYLNLLGGSRNAADYEQRVAENLVTRRWHSFVGRAIQVDRTEIEETYRRQNERTRLDYVIVENDGQPVADTVSDARIREWYESHPEDYRREETRKIRYVVVDRDGFDDVEIGEQQIADYYATNQDRYRHPDQRRARHILFRIEGMDEDAKAAARREAEAALAQIEGGADFAELARELSDDPVSGQNGGDLGFFGREEMVPAFSEAAFATDTGELAPLTESPFGFHVIQVTGARDEGTLALEEAREEIRQTLGVQQAQQRVLDEAQRIRDRVGDDAARLAEVAEAEGLEVLEHTMVGRGRLGEIGATPQFTVTVTGLEAGAVSQPLPMASGMAVVAVDEVLPPAVAPLSEVRDRVRDDVLAEQRREAAVAAGRAALDEHLDFAAAAAELGEEVRDSGNLAPGQAVPGVGGAVPELADEIFGDHVLLGKRGVLPVPAGALVYEVSDRTPFDPDAFEENLPELRENLLLERRFQYGQSVLVRLRESQTVEVNPRTMVFN